MYVYDLTEICPGTYVCCTRKTFSSGVEIFSKMFLHNVDVACENSMHYMYAQTSHNSDKQTILIPKKWSLIKQNVFFI